MFVKVCGLRDADGVEAAVSAGVDAIGFVFHPKSVRNIPPQEAQSAADAAPPHITRVAVMRHPSNDEWQAVLEGFSPHVLQTDAGDFQALDVPDTVKRWPVFREGGTLPGELIDTFLYEGKQSGAGETVDWGRAARITKQGNMILAGGLDPANVAAAITAVRPYGVDVSSGVESAPGVKDATLIYDFVTAAKAAWRNL